MAEPRESVIAKLKREEFDLVVIGGGATGCGIALDAASRGLKTALIERGDYAEGTSGRSTKLVHGGVRYLEKAVKSLSAAQYQLVREGLRERAVILNIAPHLAHSLSLVTPIYRALEIPYVWAGLKLYDSLAGGSRLEKSRLLSPKALLTSFPNLSPENLKAGVFYQDGQFNDARMAIALVQTAEDEGAACANYVEAVGIEKRGGKVSAALVADKCDGEKFAIRAKGVINASGPFADGVRKLDDPSMEPMVTASTGIHIALDKSFAPGETALLIPKTEDGRLLFVIPWEGGVIAGSTDNLAAPERHPKVKEEEIDYLLRHLGCYLARKPERKDVLSAWSGVRPLVAGTAATTEAIVREHRLEWSKSGLLTIAGGKWTSYRRMAREAVDAAIGHFGLSPKGGCATARLVLNGSKGFRNDGFTALEKTTDLQREVAIHLNKAYGDRAPRIGSLCDRGLGGLLHRSHRYVEAEATYAAREEYALKPMDVLCRRTPLALLDLAAAVEALPAVAALMGRELGWSGERLAAEKEEALAQLKSAL